MIYRIKLRENGDYKIAEIECFLTPRIATEISNDLFSDGFYSESRNYLRIAERKSHWDLFYASGDWYRWNLPNVIWQKLIKKYGNPVVGEYYLCVY